jgi:hypothetical protein
MTAHAARLDWLNVYTEESALVLAAARISGEQFVLALQLFFCEKKVNDCRKVIGVQSGGNPICRR